MAKKERIDVLLVERGLAESRDLAERLLMAGQVRVAGQVVLQGSTAVDPAAEISLAVKSRFVSRGGDKLEGALLSFGLEVQGRVCADVGASTGGFTDCLLQHGAARVYAIDVGHGILDWRLRQDGRVVVMEETNARSLEHLAEAVSLVTVDASFISIKLLLPVIQNWLAPAGEVIALIKPQFEAGKLDVARGRGVIRDPAVHRQVLEDVLSYAQAQGWRLHGLIRSPLLGPKGNVEFLAWLSAGADSLPALDLAAQIRAALAAQA